MKAVMQAGPSSGRNVSYIVMQRYCAAGTPFCLPLAPCPATNPVYSDLPMVRELLYLDSVPGLRMNCTGCGATP